MRANTERCATVEWVARPNLAAIPTTSALSTGKTPGNPRSTAQAWVFGGAPEAVDAPEKILLLVASCASDPQVRVVTETRTVEVPVEVSKPLPETLIRAVPYPQALPENFTVDDLIDLTFDLFDALDQANSDKARAGELTQPRSSPAVPE